MSDIKKFDTGLSDAQRERLHFLVEELGEVAQAVGKTLRHGFDSRDPTIPYSMTNRHWIEQEVGDLTAAILLLIEAKDLCDDTIQERIDHKKKSVMKWMHYQPVDEVKLEKV